MRAKVVNELANFEEKDPHGSFDRAKEILLTELKEHISPELLSDPTRIRSEELHKLVSAAPYSGEILDKSSWKTIFTEEYIAPILDALKVIQEKTAELEDIEGVGFLNYPKKSWKDKFKKFTNR